MIAIAGAAAAGTRPSAGTRFAGKTSQGRTINLQVVKGGGLKMDFVEIATCNRGPKRKIRTRFAHDKPHVKSDGSFDCRKACRNLPPMTGIGESFDDLQHIHGVFGDRKHVTGYFEENSVGHKGLKCQVRLTFNARRAR